jgi:hypothetical protein
MAVKANLADGGLERVLFEHEGVAAFIVDRSGLIPGSRKSIAGGGKKRRSLWRPSLEVAGAAAHYDPNEKQVFILHSH